MEPYILNIETSTKTCSVALSHGRKCLALAEDFEGEHTKVLNTLIRSVLTQSNLKLNQLDAIAVNEGPGSYTALRIGVVTAKGMSYALDKPLILVSGFKMIAHACRQMMPENKYYLSLIDARRDEVYLAIYTNQLSVFHSPQASILNNELTQTLGISDQASAMAGTGAAKWSQFIDNWQPKLVPIELSSTLMIPLALDQFFSSDFTEAALAKPFYLKLPNITTPKDKFITH